MYISANSVIGTMAFSLNDIIGLVIYLNLSPCALILKITCGKQFK